MLVFRISNGVGEGIGFWVKEDSCKVVGGYRTSFYILEWIFVDPITMIIT
jgi:hypothetical protein